MGLGHKRRWPVRERNFNNSSNPVVVSVITNAITIAGRRESFTGCTCRWTCRGLGRKQWRTGWEQENTVSTNQPVQAGSFTNVIAVAAGTNFSLALTRSGEVWSWGTNNLGGS